jgi:hypothetical protein
MIVFLFPHEGKKPGKNFIGGSTLTLTLSLKGEGINGFAVRMSCMTMMHCLASKPAKLANPKQINS